MPKRPFKKEMLQITSNSLVKQYLRELAMTGLYARSAPGTAHQIIQVEIRRQIKAGRLRQLEGYDDAGEEDLDEN